MGCVCVGIIAPCLVNFIMADTKAVQNCISTGSFKVAQFKDLWYTSIPMMCHTQKNQSLGTIRNCSKFYPRDNHIKIEFFIILIIIGMFVHHSKLSIYSKVLTLGPPNASRF